MSTFNPEAKVGVLVVIGLIVLGFMAVKVEKTGFLKTAGYDVQVYFDSASGLAPDVQVEVAGVEVGRVKQIALDQGKALITLRINEKVMLPRNSKIAIKTRGILGDKYVEIKQGSSTSLIEPGGMIEYVVSPVELDALFVSLGEILTDIKKLSGSLSDVFGNEQSANSMRQILANLNQMTETLNQTVQTSHSDISRLASNLAVFSDAIANPAIAQTIENFSKFSETLKNIGEKNSGDINRIVENSKDASGNLNTLLSKLISVSEKADRISEKIDSGQGAIGKLINDDTTVTQLNTALSSVNTYLSQQEKYKTYVDYTGEYLIDSQDVKSYLTLRLQPREDKYYLLQIVGDPAGDSMTTDYNRTLNGVVSTEREVEIKRDSLKFSAQIAKRYYNLGIRGGFFESTGGVGLDYYLFDDTVSVSFEAFDFDSTKHPHLKLKASFSPFDHVYLSIGLDDFISEDQNESWFIGGGIQFSDEDIKTLISNIPLSF